MNRSYTRPDAANILLVDDTPAKLLTYEVVLAELGERGRILIRPSGTEPVVRVMVEAREASLSQACAQRLADALGG